MIEKSDILLAVLALAMAIMIWMWAAFIHP